MKKPVLAAVLFAGVVLAYIVYASMNLARYRVEVCMEFHGQQNCRTAAGDSEEHALRAAITNACATIASGVTDSIACERANPVRMTWIKK